MEHYKKLFSNLQEKEPAVGSYIHLCVILKGSNESKRMISKLFDSLIPKNDFLKSEKIELIDYLCKVALK